MSDLVLFFDIDGTMLHTGGAGRKAMELALREEFRIPEPFEAVHTAGRTDRGIENEVFARCGIPLTLGERQRFMRAYLDRLPQCLRELLGGLLPGVRPLLEELSRNPRVHLSLLTGNYAEGAWMKLRHFQIAEFFSGGGLQGSVIPNATTSPVTHSHMSSQPCKNKSPETPSGSSATLPLTSAVPAPSARKAAAVATGIYAADELHPHSPDELFENFADTAQVVSRLLAELQHT
jgi:phosphoglycolate phosphatase